MLDTSTNQFIKQYSTHPGPVALALTPDRGTLYVSTGAGVIDVINLASGTQSSFQVTLPQSMQMTRIGVTAKGTLFAGIFNPNIIYDSRLIEIDPNTGTFTQRLQNFNGNYIELGLSRDGTHAFISSDLEGSASGNTLYYWDSFTDSFRQQGVPGWSDYAVDDEAKLLIGGGLTYDPAFLVHNTFQTFDFDWTTASFLWGEKLDDSGALAIRPSQDSLFLYDVHQGNRVARVALPAQPAATLDAMALDSIHRVAYVTTAAGLLKVPLPNVFAVGRIEPAQGLTSGGQAILVRGIGFQQHATVSIGGQPAATTFVSSTTLQVVTPTLPLGNASVVVTNDDGRVYNLPGAYAAVDSQPILATTSPSQLRVGMCCGYQGIGIIGMNFAPGAVALWNGSPRSTSFVDDSELLMDLLAADTASVGAGTLTVRNPDGGLSNQITVPIRNYPQVNLPQGFTFPAQAVNTSSAIQTGTVTNFGTDPVALSFSAPTPFTLTTDCPSTIAAGANCTLSVGFNPTNPITYNSVISVRGDITGSINLTGVAGLATSTITAAPTQVKFPPTLTSSPTDASVIVTNIGIPNVTINRVVTDSTEFSAISYLGTSLITGQSGTISVSFRPGGVGMRTGRLIIDSTAGTVVVPLTGTGATQGLGFDSSSLTVQAIKGQTTASKAVASFQNKGALGVNIVGINLLNDGFKNAFSQTNNCPTVLNSGSSCQITVSYSPSASAPDTGSLSVSTATVAYSLPLTGVVTDFSLGATTASASVPAGQTASYSVSVDASGGYRGNLSFSCTGAPAYSTCSVSPQIMTAGSATSTVTVSVVTTARTSASLRKPLTQYLALAMLSIGCMLLVKPGRRKPIWMVVLVLCMTGFSSCGGGSGGGTPPQTRGTPPGAYALTVTAATPEGATRATTLTLNVN